MTMRKMMGWSAQTEFRCETNQTELGSNFRWHKTMTIGQKYVTPDRMMACGYTL